MTNTKKKYSDLLYKFPSTEIRLSGTKTNTTAGNGIVSSVRESSVTGKAKFSTIGLLLDKILIDQNVFAYESDIGVYAEFDDYKGYFDGNKLTWMSENHPSDYKILMPVLVYLLSKYINNETANEIKQYFRDLTNSKDANSVAFICDAFYYGWVVNQNNEFLTFSEDFGLMSIIDRGIETQKFTVIDGFSDKETGELKSKLDKKSVSIDDLHVDYEWKESQLDKITPKKALDSFVMTETAMSIGKKVKYRMDKVINRLNQGLTGNEAIGSDYINLLMVGRPATGKTALANAISAMTGMPIYTVPFSKHTEEDTVEGKNKIVDGKIDFVETSFLEAYENGGIIVCEEINLADPVVVMGSLGQAIEKPFILMKDGYKPIKRHPLCVIIATMNTGTAGSRSLNQALSSRFKNTYILDDPDKRTFIEILSKAGYEKKNCRYVYDAYTRIINYLKSPEQSQEDLCENLTLRGCFGALEALEEGESEQDAIIHSLIGKIAEVDLEIARMVENDVVMSLPKLA